MENKHLVNGLKEVLEMMIDDLEWQKAAVLRGDPKEIVAAFQPDLEAQQQLAYLKRETKRLMPDYKPAS